MKTHSHQDELARLWLAGWLAAYTFSIYFDLFCWRDKESGGEPKRVIQSGEPGHVNAAVSTINYSTQTVWDMLCLYFLSISLSALSLLYFISPYYEDSVKPLSMKWAIHAWLQGIKESQRGASLCGHESPFWSCV